ncbi:CIA30 family protein [Shewanella gaetbuli]
MNLTQSSHFVINNDTVMGGFSSSRIDHKKDHVIFSGVVSLENNGGFASVQCDIPSPTKVVNQCIIKVKGDGKRYQLRLKTAELKYGEAYVAEFNTLAGQVTEHIFIASDFQLSFRGRDINTGPELQFSDVEKVGWLIANKQQGNFNISLYSIEFA